MDTQALPQMDTQALLLAILILSMAMCIFSFVTAVACCCIVKTKRNQIRKRPESIIVPYPLNNDVTTTKI